MKYGEWTLASEPFYAHGHAMAHATCGSCGRTCTVRMYHLTSGRSRSCVACSHVRGGKRGPRVSTTQLMEFNGIQQTLERWLAEYGTSLGSYRDRVGRGMDPFEAITRPAGRVHNQGVGVVAEIVVDALCTDGDGETMVDVADAAQLSRQRIGQLTELALQRAQVTAVTERLVRALWHWSDDQLGGLVAFALVHMPSPIGPVRVPRGVVLQPGEHNPSFGASIVLREMPVAELVKQYNVWSAKERQEAA